MRSVEILVITTNMAYAKEMFRSICDEIIDQSDEMVIGFLSIDEQLQIHLYAFCWTQQANHFVWDIVCRKALGSVVLFDWNDPASLKKMKDISNYFETNYELPLVVASKLNNENGTLPVKLYRGGLSVTRESRFTFFHPKDPTSSRELLVGLINTKLELLSKD